VRRVPLTQGKYALVDDEDYDAVSAFKWCAHRRGTNWYAMRALPRITGVTQPKQTMHRFLMPDAPYDVDHRDTNGLNNTRENLRAATRSQNRCNGRRRSDSTSGFKGVTRDKRSGSWKAQAVRSGKRVSLGRFPDALDAARAYDRHAATEYGEFARPNFSDRFWSSVDATEEAMRAC